MTLKTVKPLVLATLGLLLALPVAADCKSLKIAPIRLSNGAILAHTRGDIFHAKGLDADTYNVHLNNRKYVLMRINFEHFQCFG
ncbi:hypothetical protein HQ393_12935 [Chitinibacter bivalviorum]|uniref:Uncharacterized protein n=1 Tax=Chitinibacter bivalviorum TaxID=2739434 RepID=A0A7H9BL02_9NEIS|nr:hypothetical protein [Chitinibacter bivalviorum]QLG89072.1 hypothetical protein HQ393_12935 [Chitinibacter bivalviorum]